MIFDYIYIYTLSSLVTCPQSRQFLEPAKNLRWLSYSLWSRLARRRRHLSCTPAANERIDNQISGVKRHGRRSLLASMLCIRCELWPRGPWSRESLRNNMYRSFLYIPYTTTELLVAVATKFSARQPNPYHRRSLERKLYEARKRFVRSVFLVCILSTGALNVSDK